MISKSELLTKAYNIEAYTNEFHSLKLSFSNASYDKFSLEIFLINLVIFWCNVNTNQLPLIVLQEDTLLHLFDKNVHFYYLLFTKFDTDIKLSKKVEYPMNLNSCGMDVIWGKLFQMKKNYSPPPRPFSKRYHFEIL